MVPSAGHVGPPAAAGNLSICWYDGRNNFSLASVSKLSDDFVGRGVLEWQITVFGAPACVQRFKQAIRYPDKPSLRLRPDSITARSAGTGSDPAHTSPPLPRYPTAPSAVARSGRPSGRGAAAAGHSRSPRFPCGTGRAPFARPFLWDCPIPSPPIVSSVGVPRLQPGPGVGASLPTACQFRRREVPDSAPGYKPPPRLGPGPRLAATTVPLDPREWVSRLSHRSPRRNALG